MKPMSALRSTAVLTAVSLFSQAVGFVYRVALSRLVGAQVMGLFHLVMPVSSVLLSLTAVGFTAACSHLTARYHALGEPRAAEQVVRGCLRGFLVAVALCALTVIPLSDAISVCLLRDARARLGLLLLLPWVLLTGTENIHKHYFYGTGNVRPPAFAEVCEQLIRAGAVLALLGRFLPQSPEVTVGLIVCGMILCEVFSSVTLLLLCRRAWSRTPPGAPLPRRALAGQIGHIALPLGATALLGNLMGACTTVLIPQRLIRAGQEVEAAMGAFGVLCGMTLPLLSLPTAFLSAMALVLLPRLTQCAALGRMELFRARTDRALTAAAWLILPGAALLGVLAPTLGRALFRNDDVGCYALPLAVGVVLSCFEAVLSVCLNALGRQRLNAALGLFCGGLQLLLTWWRMALPGVGLRGYVEAVVVSAGVGAFLNWQAVRRLAALPFRWYRWLVGPGLSAALGALCAHLLLPVLSAAGLGEGAAGLGCLGLGVLLYLCAMAAQGLLGRVDTGAEM